MKKINSIWYGGKVILLGIVLAIVLPIGIMIIPFDFSMLHIISYISFTIGVIILVGFSVLLIIELHQDKKLNAYYHSQRIKKLVISEHKYECQVCGNREIKKDDTRCNICGAHFVDNEY